MVDVPSPLASSAAQSVYQSREVAKLREAEGAARSNAANRQTTAIDEAGRTVDTGDADDRVFADSEGQGGQGRAGDNEDEQPTAPAGGSDSAGNGISKDAEGRLHIDLQA